MAAVDWNLCVTSDKLGEAESEDDDDDDDDVDADSAAEHSSGDSIVVASDVLLPVTAG